jgi:hypothetical protein
MTKKKRKNKSCTVVMNSVTHALPKDQYTTTNASPVARVIISRCEAKTIRGKSRCRIHNDTSRYN